MVTSHKQGEQDLQNLWSVESIGISPATSIDPDEQFVQNYSSSSISQCTDGSYMARFPWKNNILHYQLTSTFAGGGHTH